MSGVRKRRILCSAPVEFLFVAVLFAGATYLLPRAGTNFPRSAATSVVGGLLYGAYVVARHRRVRAITGDLAKADRLVLARSLESGEVPDDPTFAPSLSQLIVVRRSENRGLTIFMAAVYGTCALLSGILGVTTAEPVWFAYSLFFLGILGWIFRRSALSERQFRSLEATLERKA